MWFLITAGFVFLLIICVPVRIIIQNFPKAMVYCAKDLKEYIKYKQWKYAPVGFLHAYTGLFGMGKTLSSVKFAYDYFNRYNNQLVYDPFEHKYVMQYVMLLSNVALPGIPEQNYTYFESMEQIVKVAEEVKPLLDEKDIRIVTLVLGDEFSVQMNSRNFKSNLDPLTLSTILTCRHHGISLVYTAQRFQHVDALLRQVTERVIECKKIWRIQCLNYFDAWQLENASSSLAIRPMKRTGYLVEDKHYNQYDSIATVKNLIKEWREGNLYDEETILNLIGTQQDKSDPVKKKRKRKRKR